MAYFRRYRMEINLHQVPIPKPVLPPGYRLYPWNVSLLERHAMVKYESFHAELDSQVFPCLADVSGCYRLMDDIAHQANFLPETTWLISYQPSRLDFPVDCGTIQGLAQGKSLGAVQNVGIVREHRRMGLGRALLLKALKGFRTSRMKRVYLEVTADNLAAVHLYRSLGFRLVRTIYKTAEPAEASVC